MRKLIIILATLVICIGLSTSILTQEKGDTSFLIAVSKDSKEKLRDLKTIAIFLSGNDSLLTRIVEDALSIYLTNAGFNVINREVLEKSVGEHVARMKKEKTEGAINALEIGVAVNANSVLTGTIVIGSEEKRSLLIKIASFQLVDVTSGKTLIIVLFESEKDTFISEIAKRFTDILKQNIE